ncbi:unnamed protein product, partial [Nesidiocoris tenuis]
MTILGGILPALHAIATLVSASVYHFDHSWKPIAMRENRPTWDGNATLKDS